MKTFAPISMMAEMALPLVGTDDPVPTEVHLLPAGKFVTTVDNRGPFPLHDAEKIIAASFADRDRIEIDINHATFLAGPMGGPAPAAGWITSMHARADGIWGVVEWTKMGRELIADRAYRGVSPVLSHVSVGGPINAIRNASLVNRPNIAGLTTLHMTQEMPVNWLIEMLGLGADATEDDMKAAVEKALEAAKMSMNGEGAKDEDMMTMNAQFLEIGTAFGLPENATRKAIVTAAKAKAGAAPDELASMHAEMVSMGVELKALKEGGARSKAETFVDAAIKEGRVGVRPQRDRYITMHMEDAANVEALIGSLPALGASGMTALPPAAKDGEITLNSEQVAAAKMLGIPQESYLATLKAKAEKGAA